MGYQWQKRVRHMLENSAKSQYKISENTIQKSLNALKNDQKKEKDLHNSPALPILTKPSTFLQLTPLKTS